MGLNHQFISVDLDSFQIQKCPEYRRSINAVEIHDDLIGYMYDTLAWVPCTHISGNRTKKATGLMLYGTSLIERDVAEVLLQVIESWASLFSAAPKTISLTGHLMLTADGNLVDPLQFHKSEFWRDAIVRDLKSLSGYASKVLDRESIIIHFGI